MHKKAVLLFLVPILLPLLGSIANAGCCFDKNSVGEQYIFCTDTKVCSNYNTTVNCQDVCKSVSEVPDACCLDDCSSAKIGTFVSSKACADETKFRPGDCTQFPECEYLCIFCSGVETPRGYLKYKDGLAECTDTGQTVAWIEPATEDECNDMRRSITPSLITISGYVRDENKVLLGGVNVSAAGRSTLSSDISSNKGYYTLTNLPNGTYTVIASKQDFTSASRTSTFRKSNTAVNFTLTNMAPTGAVGSLSGTVYYSMPDRRDIRALGATVSVGGYIGTTGAGGAYLIKDIPVNTKANPEYQVAVTPAEANASQFQTLFSTVTISTSPTTMNFNLILRSAEVAELTVIVKNTTNQANIPGANIVITKTGATTPSATAVTPLSGIYRVNLTIANYTVVVYKEGYETTGYSILSPINLVSKTTVTANLIYRSPAEYSITGIVREEFTNKLISGVLVFIQAPLSQLQNHGTTGADGRYTIDRLINTSYSVVAQKSGYIEQSVTANLNGANSLKILTLDITLTPAKCLTDAALPNITRITIQKAASRTNISIEFNATCKPSMIYIYRCKGTDCVTQPIKELIGTARKFSDTNVELGESYKYQVMAFYDSGLLGKVFSEPKTVSLGVKECFSKQKDNQVCIGETRYSCNANNSVTELKDQPKKALCIYTSSTTTVYIDNVDCSQCNPPLGLFSYIGSLNIGVNKIPVNCNEVNLITYPNMDAMGCYLDYTSTTVDKYLSCNNVNSCYDYKSSRACSENKCIRNTPCHWNNYNSKLGIGVCVPNNTALHDCSRCSQSSGKFNKLFMSCSEDLCKTYGRTGTETTCYFTADNRCINRRDASCEDYFNSKADCGIKNVSIAKDITNNIINESNDYFQFDLCRFGFNNYDTCAKDANNDNLKDINTTKPASDMQAPYTVVLHPLNTNSISFDYVVYDPVNNTPVSDAVTYFNVTKGQSSSIRVTLKTFQKAEGKISYPVPTGDNYYTIFYYSQDSNSNLEKIRNFTVFVDQTAPNIKAGWIYGGEKDVTLTLESYGPEEIVSCIAVLYDSNNNAQQTENNLWADAPAKSFSRTYSLEDGIYYYNYTCYDLVGNKAEDRKAILVDRNNIVFNGQPNGTINYNQVTLSVDTAIDAECRYSINPIDDFFTADAFEQTQPARHHTVSKDLSSLKNDAVSYYVRCMTETEELTAKGVNPKIIFTIDKTAPKTTATSDAETVWKKQAVVSFACSDTPIYGVTYREFGCDATYACMVEPGSAPCQPTIPVKLLGLSSYKKVCYQSVDKGRNAEAVNCITPKIDRDSPFATILTQSFVTNNETAEIYAEIDNSAYYQSNITSVQFRIGGVLVDEITSSSLPTDTTAIFTVSKKITLPNTLTKKVNPLGNNGLLTVVAIDSAGNFDTSDPILIRFDKWGPVLPPVLDPLLSDYHSSGYPLYLYGNTYYTNQEHIYISGSTSEETENLTFWVNDDKKYEYMQQSTVEMSDSLLFNTVTKANAGSDRIVVSISQEDIDYYLNMNYSYLEFEGVPRTNYGNYSRFYRIKSTTPKGGGNIELKLDAALEQDVPERTAFRLYNQFMPGDRFIAPVNLTTDTANKGFGNNTFYVGQKDNLGNDGTTTAYFNVIYDSRTPVRDSAFALTDDGPISLANGSKFQSVKAFNFTVSNVNFGLRDDIVVKANGVALPTTSVKISAGKFMINAQSMLADGHYIIELFAVDYAGNTNYTRWEIDVDKFAPRRPLVKMLNAHGTAPDGFMVTKNQTPAFNINFRNDQIQVYMEIIDTKNLITGKINKTAVTCTKVPLNNYTCSMNMVLSESDYELIIYPFKQLAGFNNSAEYHLQFSVDRTPPDITQFYLKSGNYVTNSAPIVFIFSIVSGSERGSERHDLKTVIKLNSTISGHNYNYLMNIPTSVSVNEHEGQITPENLSRQGISLGHGERWTLSANVSDYAGNYNDLKKQRIIVDTVPPNLRNVVINAIPRYEFTKDMPQGVQVGVGDQSKFVYNYTKYTVQNDLISIVGNTFDNDSGVKELRIYRANKQINPTLGICTFSNHVCVNNETGNFTFMADSTVTGEVGIVTPNILYIKVIDNALNEKMEPFFIYRDREKPRVKICVEGGIECTNESKSEVIVISAVSDIKTNCGSDQTCYDMLIGIACDDAIQKTGQLKEQCYKDYIVKIENPNLNPLCQNTALYSESCIFDLAVKSKSKDLCNQLPDSQSIKDCKAEIQ